MWNWPPAFLSSSGPARPPDEELIKLAEQNKLAIELLDQGNVEACRKTLEDNTRFLSINAVQLRSESLEKDAVQNSIQLKELEGVTSNAAPGAVRSRKVGRDYELKADQQATKP